MHTSWGPTDHPSKDKKDHIIGQRDRAKSQVVKKLAIVPQIPTTDSVEEAIPSSPTNKFEENHGVEHTNKSQVNTKDLITQLE